MNPESTTELVSSVQVPPTTPVSPAQAATAVKYAGFWIRFLALMVDSLIVTIVLIPLSIVWAVSSVFMGELGGIVSQIFSLIGPWLYYILFTHYKGATPGKMFFGLTVKSDTFQNLSIGRIIIRETIGKIISTLILLIGYIMAAFTEKKQTLHDMMVHSVVIYKDGNKPETWKIVVATIVAVIIPAIAILGILSSVVLASLGVARIKADDSRTKSLVTSVKSELDLYLISNESYGRASGCSMGVFASERVASLLSQIKSATTCQASGTSYAVSAVVTEGNHCVDSTGVSKSGVAVIEGNEAMCVEEKITI